MLPPGFSSSEVLLTESAMVASVSEVEDASSTSTNDFNDSCTIRNLYDIRGYCHFDLPDAEFRIIFDESESQFVVELLSGPHIVLHVNFRIHKHTVVFNTYSHGSWGHELHHDSKLHNGDHFHLHIHVHEHHYDIELNGHSISHFEHRFPVESAQALGVRGGLHVRKIEFNGFSFHHPWKHDHGEYDWGHGGYIGYGTDSYNAPQFHDNHPHGRHWN